MRASQGRILSWDYRAWQTYQKIQKGIHDAQARNQLRTPGGAKSFVRGVQNFWTMSYSFKLCPTHFFPEGAKNCTGGLRHPWLRIWWCTTLKTLRVGKTKLATHNSYAIESCLYTPLLLFYSCCSDLLWKQSTSTLQLLLGYLWKHGTYTLQLLLGPLDSRVHAHCSC